MSLFNGIKLKYKTLPDEVESSFIDTIVEELTSEEYIDNYYAFKHSIIKLYTIAIYTDEELSEIDTNKIYKRIRRKININQYWRMLESIDEGIHYKINKNSSSIGDFGGLDKAVGQIDDLVNKYGMDRIQEIAKLGLQDNIINLANEEVKEVVYKPKRGRPSKE